MIKGFTFAPANVDERAVAPEITTHIHGLLGADKGYISPSLTSYYDAQGVDLQTPLRANMKEDRPKPVVRRLMKARRIVETVIGQLSERFTLCTRQKNHPHPIFIGLGVKKLTNCRNTVLSLLKNTK